MLCAVRLWCGCAEAQRALELLQRYRSTLGQRTRSQGPDRTGPGGPDRTDPGGPDLEEHDCTGPGGPDPAEHDLQLQKSLDRVITVFQSQLFNALLGVFKDPISCFFRVNNCIWGYY